MGVAFLHGVCSSLVIRASTLLILYFILFPFAILSVPGFYLFFFFCVLNPKKKYARKKKESIASLSSGTFRKLIIVVILITRSKVTSVWSWTDGFGPSLFPLVAFTFLILYLCGVIRTSDIDYSLIIEGLRNFLGVKGKSGEIILG